MNNNYNNKTEFVQLAVFCFVCLFVWHIRKCASSKTQPISPKMLCKHVFPSYRTIENYSFLKILLVTRILSNPFPRLKIPSIFHFVVDYKFYIKYLFNRGWRSRHGKPLDKFYSSSIHTGSSRTQTQHRRAMHSGWRWAFHLY